MRRVAAIDCGTNSIRLLIADVDDGGGCLRDITRQMEVVRLGQGVDRTGRLDPGALVRTLAVADRYAQLCQQHHVEAIRFVATSATRDAANREEFFTGVRTRFGVDAEVISGSEEAALSFAGATSVLADEPVHGAVITTTGAGKGEAGQASTAGRLVVDIGGGSTELVLGTGRTMQAEASVDVGCVRMSERHLATDPPTAQEIHAATADIDTALDNAEQRVPLDQVRTVVGVAGSITTVTAHALHLPDYDHDRINGARLPVDEIRTAAAQLLHMLRAERGQLPFMHPGRVDVIGAGALVWDRVLARVHQRVTDAGAGLDPVVTSEHDILDGIALSLA